MEPCMYRIEILNCFSPPPVFNVPEPSWRFDIPTTSETPSTDVPSTIITDSTLVSTVLTNVSTGPAIISTEPTSTPVSTTTITEPNSTVSTTTITVSPTTITEPKHTYTASTTPVPEPSAYIAAIIVPVVVIVALIIILAVLWWRKKRVRHQQAMEVQPTFGTQISTVGLMGTDEADGNGKTDLKESGTVCYVNDGNHSTENDKIASSKDRDSFDDHVYSSGGDKPAPVIQITEL